MGFGLYLCALLCLGGNIIGILGHEAVHKAYVVLSDTGERFKIHDGAPTSAAVAWGSFENAINKTGFGYLEISTNVEYRDDHQAYAAGILEGYLTRELIRMDYRNTYETYCENQTAYCNKLDKFMRRHFIYINSKIKRHAATDPYWHQVALVYKQLAGLEDSAYGAPNEAYRGLNTYYSSMTPLLLTNMHGDLYDLEALLMDKPELHDPTTPAECSALIKVLDDLSDIYVSHVTWTKFRTMLRILKKYSLQYHMTATSKSVIPGNTFSFSSYPSRILSGDDFYILNTGLIVQETTISNNNPDRYKYIKPQSNMEWVRNLVANRLATDGKTWCDIMEQHNSGTYNNQWMVLDYNKFTPGRPIEANSGLLHIMEQIPGMVIIEDRSKDLKSQGYWPSYNIPHNEVVFNASGWWKVVKKYGDWFLYDKNPRGRIFSREQSKITNLDEMIRVMRYNDYTRDPLSRCNCTPPYSASNAISSRADLNPVDGQFPFKSIAHSNIGGTDMKVTTFELAKKLEFKAVSGPTYDNVPPFRWSTSRLPDRHEGHPDVFAFKPHIHQWSS